MTFQQIFKILVARKKIVISVALLVIIVTGGISFILPKQYTAEVSIAIDTVKVDPLTNMPLAGQLVPGYLATQVDIITSHNTARKVVEIVGLNHIPEAQEKYQTATNGKGDIVDWLADSIVKDLDVIPSRESSVITLRYTSQDPAFASTMANTYVDAYKKAIIEMRSNLAQQNNLFFQQQLQSLQAKLESAQNDLAEYQQVQGIVASDERIDIENQHLNDLSAQLAAAQGALIDAQSRVNEGKYIAPDVLNNPLIQQLKSQLAIQQANFNQISSKEGPNHPIYKQALAELNSARSQLEEQIVQYSHSLDNTAKNMKERLTNLKLAVESQKKRVLELKAQRTRMDVLQRDVDNAQQTYLLAMQKLSESSLESSSDMTNISILKAAPEPIKPSKPKVFLNLLIATFLGGVLSILSALLIEKYDRRIRCVYDAEQILNFPTLGSVKFDNKT